MPKYNVYIDASHDWEEDSIEVIGIEVTANNAEQAWEIAKNEVNEGKHNEELQGRETYVWSVSERDKVEEEAHAS